MELSRHVGSAGPLAALALYACTPDAPSDPGSTTGTIVVSVTTSGADAPDGYQVTLDDDGPRSIGSNAQVSYQGILPGKHTIELTAVPPHCGVDGTNPRETTVAEAATSEVGFTVTCSAMPRGALSVTTATSGDDLDSDGYAVSLDGAGSGPIGLDDTRVFSGLPTGDHEVELTDLAENCAVQGSNPRTVPISDDQTTPTTFAVVCTITTGSIEVEVSTSGIAQDTDGYTVDLDGERSEQVEPDGRVTFTQVAPGAHSVTLGDIRSTCEVDGDNPVETEVTAGETAEVAFDVECSIF